MGNPFEETGYRSPHRSDRGAAASDDASSGAPPSNRAPDSCKPVTFEVFSKHVDSLELSSKGQLKPGIESRLEQLKLLAQSKDESEQAQAQFVIRNEVFAVLERGSSFFPYALKSANFFIRLSQRLETSKMPYGLCQVRSHYLLSHGPTEAHDRLTELLQDISEIREELTVSRLDPAVDFTTDADMEGWTPQAWVTRIRAKNSYTDGSVFTGWKIGTHKDPVSLRLYNKTHETKDQFGTAPIHEVWARNGHGPWDTVWRVEGEFHREALNRFSLRTLPEVLASLNSLWQYLTDDVVRLTIPTPSNQTRGHWKCHPLWERIRAVTWDGGQPLARRRVITGAPSDEYFARQANSLVTSMMARENLLDPEGAYERIKTIAVEHLADQEVFTGQSPMEAMIDRARAKGRQYHTMQNVPADLHLALPAPDALAVQAYRRASDGG